MPKKLSQSQVFQKFKDRDCKLLNKYTGYFGILQFICPYGHKAEIRYVNFQKGSGCRTCYGKVISARELFSLETVKEFFKKRDYKLLSNCYSGIQKKLDFECPVGHIGSMTLSNFLRGRKCAKCALVSRAEKKRLPFDLVKNFFKLAGYILLDVYKHCHTPMLISCPNGHQIKMSFSNFKAGKRCIKCHLKNKNGWLKQVDTENIPEKMKVLYSNWRQSVFIRDNFKCYVCHQNKNRSIRAHHLNGWNWCTKQRHDTNNGITLCNCCHKEFHKIYDYGDNTKAQFIEFLNKKNISIPKFMLDKREALTCN